MGALPVAIETARELPDYLPARMVNEFAYCPRLFFYEWVDGIFQESVDTIEGAIQHKRVDEKATALPKAEDLPQSIHSRSVTLASESLRVIAKLDLVEAEAGWSRRWITNTGVRARDRTGWNCGRADRAQLALQGIALRENGYDCREGIVYYRMTGQRVRVEFDEALIAETRRLAAAAWQLATAGEIPPPLVDSPKCPGCSLVGICLPDETLAVGEAEQESAPQQLELFGAPRKKPVKREVRALMTPRSELRPLYLNSQGVKVGKSGAVLQVKDKDQKVAAGGADGGDLPGEPDGERADFDAGGAGDVRGGRAGLLLLDGGLVLRDHGGAEREERVPAAEPVPTFGAGVFRAGAGAAAGGGEDSQSADAVAAEPRGAERGRRWRP